MPLSYAGNHFDGAVLPGRPHDGRCTLAAGTEAMRLACTQPAQPQPHRPACEILLLISSAAGYERRRRTLRATFLSLLRPAAPNSPLTEQQRLLVRYRFLLGAPQTAEQSAALAAEQAEHGDLLQVAVPESYETLFPKVVAAWRWAVATVDFRYWVHADDDAFVRLEKLWEWLHSDAAGGADGLYAGYIWDGSEGRRTKPIRDPEAKSYMPIEQWPHDAYPPFASGCCFILSRDLVEWLVEQSPAMTFFRVIDVPVGVYLAALPPSRVRIVHVPEIRPYRPLPLFREQTIVQHYMQPEEFKQYFAHAYERTPRDEKSDEAIAAVYDLFVGAKVLRR
ncbi:hypothetical protein AB1Y20_005631 [Prymnesium parvum]|uniref:Hexosyltransferase n=1 Tax=Prymnesium parvum TaxID=97485 RepID=A0AB34J4P7_PRYPA